MPDLITRAAATQATIDEFAGRAFDWASLDCYRVARAHLGRFGHDLPAPKYTSAVGAGRQMKRQGYASLAELLSSFCAPIPAAQMMMGDVAFYPGPCPIFGGGLLIHAGGKMIGFHEDYPGLVRIAVEDALKGAWSV